MNILKKIPEIKIPKFKFEGLEELENLKFSGLFGKSSQGKGILKKESKYERTNYKTVKEIFDINTKKYYDKDFVLEKDESGKFKEITYGNFREDVIALGTAIKDVLKMSKERISIIGENTYEWYVSYMANLCSDNISVNLDKEIPANEIINLITRSRSKVVIYTPKKKKVIDEIKDELKDVKYFIEMYSNDKINNNDVGMDYLIEEGKKIVQNGNNDFMNIDIDENEFKVLIYTSGTTSKSKGVMISNKNLAQNINAVSSFVKLYPEDRFFSVLPLHHTYESTIGFILPIANGCSISICSGLKYLLDDLKATTPTAILAVPLLIEKVYSKVNESIKKSNKENIVNSAIYVSNILKYAGIDIKRKIFKEIHDNFGGKLRIIVSAAAPIDAKIIKWFEDIGIEMLQGYGLTETAPIAALTPEMTRKAGSVGKAVDCAQIVVDNPNEEGQGELLIKSDTLMLGYYEDEEATKKAIVNGWFHSGDVGYIDASGNIFVTGRSKNVIVTKNGKNIYPEEIELLLGKYNEIKECVVCGRYNEKKEDLVITAVVVPDYSYIKKHHNISAEESEKIYDLIHEKVSQVNKNLVSYKIIKKIEIKEEEFAKTTTMKIKR